MPKINRSKTFYVKLPEDMQGKNLKEAKLQISINVTVPKDLEGKRLDNYISDVLDGVKASFKDHIKREVKRHDKNNE